MKKVNATYSKYFYFQSGYFLWINESKAAKGFCGKIASRHIASAGSHQFLVNSEIGF
jgi:hypothetical protein